MRAVWANSSRAGKNWTLEEWGSERRISLESDGPGPFGDGGWGEDLLINITCSALTHQSKAQAFLLRGCSDIIEDS